MPLPRGLDLREAMILGTGATTLDRVEAAGFAFAEYTDYQRRVIADRRSRPQQEDLVSILVHAEVDGARLDDEELLMESLLILIGGDETTRHVLSGGMYELLRHPDQMRALAANPDLLPTAIEEMLRWVSPIQNMARTASRAVKLRGQRIEAGQKLILLYPSANRDAAQFRDPSSFDGARTPNEHIAFGVGAHYCMGANLARLELRVFFEELLPRIDELALAGPVRRLRSNFINGIKSMPVHFTPERRGATVAAS